MNEDFNIPDNLSDLDDYLAEKEAAFPLKEGAEAKIVWNLTSPQKTDYAIVYLHGFRASHPEGEPVHRTVAQNFGCNLFLSRIAEHGVNAEYPLLHLTEDKLLNSARFAFEMGRRIGRKVILMGTSTGGSLALWLASQDGLKEKISSLILYSPLIRFYGIKEQLLMNPLGRKILQLTLGKKYLVRTLGTTYAQDKIWNQEYALQGALALGTFVQNQMTNTLLAEVECPTFIGYYYKSVEEQDKVVSVSAIKKLKDRLGTRTDQLHLANFPEAKNHVICSNLLSKSVPRVITKTGFFLKNIVSHTSSEKHN